MKTKAGRPVRDVILEEFESAGYNTEICVVNAAEFGVPQNRIRVMFIGIRKDVTYDPEELAPKGFAFGKDQVTVEQAIMDLLQIGAGEGADEQDYPRAPQNGYQRMMSEGTPACATTSR